MACATSSRDLQHRQCFLLAARAYMHKPMVGGSPKKASPSLDVRPGKSCVKPKNSFSPTAGTWRDSLEFMDHGGRRCLANFSAATLLCILQTPPSLTNSTPPIYTTPSSPYY